MNKEDLAAGQLTNTNLGKIEKVRGGVQLGDNHYIGGNCDDLILRIQRHLDSPNLDTYFRELFTGWVTTLKKPDWVEQIAEIRHKFATEEGKLNNLQIKKNEKLKIWLDRSDQKTIYTQCLKSFCKQKQIGAFVYCVSGNSENDVIEDATEMLQLYYFNDLLRNENNEIVKEKRINDGVSVKTEADANPAYETIMRDVLGLDFYSEHEDFINRLNTEYQNKHIVIRCKIRDWSEEGISAFFKIWLENIKRENKFPFVLLFEFSDSDFERLNQLIEAQFPNTFVALLPKLGKVVNKDLDVFYARELRLEGTKRYDEIFDRNSLKAEDTPLYYREAITKLNIKY